MAPQEPLQDMRYSYGSDRSYDSTRSSYDGDYEQTSYRPSYSNSDRSYHTQPTDYSTSPVYPTKRPALLHHHDTSPSRLEAETPSSRFFDDREPQYSPNASVASVDTYASTVPSSHGEDQEEEEEEDFPEYNLPSYSVASSRTSAPTAIPATPSDFSELFPSSRRLAVKHDDSTLDGNMNLRIDTQIHSHGRTTDMTLFHLRMHDLKKREFSLRRYCRDSGREVCHTVRKTTLQPNHPAASPEGPKRPSIQRSMSHAIRSLRTKSESKTPTVNNLQRNDSGYASILSAENRNSLDSDAARPRTAGNPSNPKKEQQPSDTIKLEFSNYAQMELRHRHNSQGGNKRWEFEYWGISYAWRRVSKKDAGRRKKEVSYHLVKNGGEGDKDTVLAYIVPAPLSTAQEERERRMGGWVPGCSFWIADRDVADGGRKDVADVIIATGLLALVDDSITTHFHSKHRKNLLVPLKPHEPKQKWAVEYIGPKRLMHEMFGRANSHSGEGQKSRPGTSRAGSGNGNGNGNGNGSRAATMDNRSNSRPRTSAGPTTATTAAASRRPGPERRVTGRV